MRVPEKEERWGILGGRFDPVHLGHLSLAEQILEIKKLDGVLFVPSYRHPFKDNNGGATYDDRLQMLRLALAGREQMPICEIEREEDLPGYTLATVRALKKRYPYTTLYFIMGEDNLADFHRWCYPGELLAEVDFLVGYRPPHKTGLPSSLPAGRIEIVATNMVDVSSTALRKALHSGHRDDLSGLVPPEVLEYIATSKVYA